MSATVCPYCNALTNFNEVWGNPNMPPGSGFPHDGSNKMSAQQCANEKCGMVVIVAMRGYDILRMWPERVGGKQFPNVPSHIAEAADEAYRCYSINAYRAAAVLARAVVEATAKEKGITKGNLLSKIDEMENQRFIREYVKVAAQEVRHFGNDIAHGDFVDPIAPEEAELVLTLMSEVLEEVFQSPARVAKAQAARLAKQTTGRTP